MKLDGLHHVTAITADINANLDFYGRVLGLRLVWQGVSAEDPSMRHIAYGDERGSSGSILTFFDMPGIARGRNGAGMVHRLVLRVAGARALDFWEGRLGAAGVSTGRTIDRLTFADPDGLGLELVLDDGVDEPLVAAAAEIDGHVAIRGMHAVHAYTADLKSSAPIVGDVLGMQPEGDTSWLIKGERRHALIVYDAAPSHEGSMGGGSMHHVAFTIRDGEQDAWRRHLVTAGLRPTRVLDRRMFKSIYFREPSGVLFELATDEPGFVFEPIDRLGESLVLVGDLESRRPELEKRFPLLANPRSSDSLNGSQLRARQHPTHNSPQKENYT